MLKRKLVILVFRLFMIYLVFELLSNLSNLFSTLTKLELRFIISDLGGGMAAAISLVLVFLLWRRSAWLRTSGPRESAAPAAQWLKPFENPYIILVSIIGMWEVFHALSGALDDVSLAYLPKLGNGPFATLLAGLWIYHSATAAIGALIGAWLFALPWQLQKMMDKFNSDGEAPVRSEIDSRFESGISPE